MPCSSPSEETNFYMTRINPAGKLQCCPDALGSCDYNEILGTDSKREGLSAGFVTVQILSLAHMPGTCLESLCRMGRGASAPHSPRPPADWGLWLPGRGWHSRSGLWPGQREGKKAQHCHCGLVPPVWTTATSWPASLLPLFCPITPSPHKGQSELLKTEI